MAQMPSSRKGDSFNRRVRAKLPHEVARAYRRMLAPSSFRHLQGLREIEVRSDTTVSVQPFIERKAIFVHIPKCGGLSVSNALFGCRGGAHIPVEAYKILFSRKEFESFFKFSFVRNPWDRLVSAYFFLKKGGLGPAAVANATASIDRFDSFEDFVKGFITTDAIWDIPYFRPQASYLCVSDRSPPEVDFIGRFETLDEDFAKICDRLGVWVEIPSINRNASRPQDFRSVYSSETRDIVESAYARDVELFGYQFE